MSPEAPPAHAPMPADCQRRLLCGLIALVIAAALFAGFRVGLQRGFDHTIGIEAWGRILFGVGGAVTSMAHGGHGYVISSEVEAALQDGGLTSVPALLAAHGLTFPANLQDAALIDTAIQRAVRVPVVASTIRGPSGDDPGMIDFVRIAFTLFGYHLRSLYFTYFVLFSLPVVAFLFAFHSRPACLAILAVAVLAHLGVFSSSIFDLTPGTLGSPTNPRFLSVLAIIPGLHLGLAMFLRLPLSWRNVGLAVIQAGMVVLGCWIRSSAVWVPVALLILAVAIAINSRSLRALWSFGLLAAFWLMHGVYLTHGLHPAYRQRGDIPRHPVWHAVFFSLQQHPEWGAKYAPRYGNPTGDDLTMIVAKDYLERHPPRHLDRLYNHATGTLKWTTIESTVRKAFFEFFVSDPKFVLATFFIHKPRLLVTELGAYMVSLGRLSVTSRVLVIAAWLVLVLILVKLDVERHVFTRGSGLLTGMFCVSLLPVLLTVTFRIALADQFFMLVVIVGAWGVALPSCAIDAVVSLARSRHWFMRGVKGEG